MTAKRQPDGSVTYRGQVIRRNDSVNPGRLGRYSVEGVPFTQLNHARAWIDQNQNQRATP